MSTEKQKFVEGDDTQDFYTDSPKGVIREGVSGTSSGVGGERGTKAPEQRIEDSRKIFRTDPTVHEAVTTLLDWVVGDGYNIKSRSVGTPMQDGVGEGSSPDSGPPEEGGQPEQPTDESPIQRVKRLLRRSNFWNVFVDWVKTAFVDGHAFMELVVEDEEFKPKILPTTKMERKEDKYGDLKFYKLEIPSGANTSGSGAGSTEIKYKPHEIAELTFDKRPTEDFAHSLIEAVSEQADMLRDMEIDYARFIATKAYPPIIWKLGNEENNWTEEQIENWMDNVQSIEPDTMLAAPHDVETDIVGTTSTSSTAGAMRLEETFKHLENRIVTGIGVPRALMNMETGGQAEATASMPSFKRRVTRLQNRIQGAVESQILMSLLAGGEAREEYQGPVPKFQFGEHSSSEKRLEIDKLLKLFNNGMLRPEAFAERAGIDPEEVPEFWNNSQAHIDNLRALANLGDSVQNPNGGRPTDTEGGAESAGGEVTSRQDPGVDSSSGRNKKSVTEDES